ncbi:MAG TPA: hypothetical protein VIJ43_02655 [Burkholderiales bacterium]
MPVSVGPGALDEFARGKSDSADFVVDDDVPVEAQLQFFREQPRARIERRARRHAEDHFERLARLSLRPAGQGKRRGACAERGGKSTPGQGHFDKPALMATNRRQREFICPLLRKPADCRTCALRRSNEKAWATLDFWLFYWNEPAPHESFRAVLPAAYGGNMIVR